MMITLTIVGVMMSVAFPAYTRFAAESKVQLAIGDIQDIEATLERYFLLHYAFPDSLADAGIDRKDPWGNPYHYVNMGGFDAKGKSTSKGKGKDKSKGGGKDKVRKDRNLHPINSDYDLYSMGPDGRSVAPLTAAPSRDDIIRASNGAFVGIAEDY